MITDAKELFKYNDTIVKLDGDDFIFCIISDGGGDWATFRGGDLIIWATVGFEVPIPLSITNANGEDIDTYLTNDSYPQYPTDFNEYVKIVDHYWFEMKKKFPKLAERGK